MRCPGYQIGNVKLAMRDHDGTRQVAMETRGEGGYSVIGGSTGHASGLPWKVAQGVLSDIAEVDHAELEAILYAAEALDQTEPKVKDAVEQVPPPAPVAGEGTLGAPSPASSSGNSVPGSAEHWMDDTIADFNDTVSVLAWLPGWTEAGHDTANGEHVVRLHRDGSDNDHGAVLFDSGRVGFFSSNCPTWAEPYDGRTIATYDPFTVMMHVDHGTDDKATKYQGSQQFYEDAGSSDKTLKLYEGHYHDLLNDLGKEQVIADIADWMDARLGARPN